MVPITDRELDKLLSFVGYGNPEACVWFLGMEEAGGGEDNIRRRLQFNSSIEDCSEAHRILGVEKHHWGRCAIQPTWRGMCCTMLALADRPASREDIRRYQADSLGRRHGNTLLIELMPIPKPSLSDWDYHELFPQFASIANYYQSVRPRRLTQLRKLLDERMPKVVICYGKKYWSHYKELFSNCRWDSRTGQFEIGMYGEALVLLTDHFTARTMNNRWAEISGVIRSHMPDVSERLS